MKMSLLNKIPKKPNAKRRRGGCVRVDCDTYEFMKRQSKKRNMSMTEFLQVEMLLIQRNK